MKRIFLVLLSAALCVTAQARRTTNSPIPPPPKETRQLARVGKKADQQNPSVSLSPTSGTTKKSGQGGGLTGGLGGGSSFGGSSGSGMPGGMESFQQNIKTNIMGGVRGGIQTSIVENTRSETNNNRQTSIQMPTVMSSGTGKLATIEVAPPGTRQYTQYLNTIVATFTNPGNGAKLDVTVELSDADILEQARQFAATGKAANIQSLVDKYPNLAVAIAGAVAKEAAKITDSNPSGAADVAAVAAVIVGNKKTVEANPKGAAEVAAAVAKVASNPNVSSATPVLSALIAVQATYVVNTPAVANNPALAQSVQDTNTAVNTVKSDSTVVASVPTLTQRVADATDAGQRNVNVTSIYKTEVASGSTSSGSTPPTVFDVSIKSGSS